jgi:hypothetical protein
VGDEGVFPNIFVMDLYIPKRELQILSNELIVIAWDIDDPSIVLRIRQDLPDNVGVGLRPAKFTFK